jgi:RNA polymerase sigma-B factor
VQRTIPRGSDRDPASDEVAVDPAVWSLHLRYQRTRDPEALALLFEEYEPYALAQARRYHRDGEPLEDLQQVAREALVVALQRFDCERHVPFPGFAKLTIVGSLKRHYRDQGWSLRVPRVVHELVVPARDAADDLRRRLGRTPTSGEVAEVLGVEESVVRQVEVAAQARSLLSVEGPTARGAPRFEIPSVDAGLRRVEERVDLSEAMRWLDDRSRTVVGLYYFEGLNQDQIAARYGVSQMQVSRWIRSALQRLRRRTESTDGRQLAGPDRKGGVTMGTA